MSVSVPISACFRAVNSREASVDWFSPTREQFMKSWMMQQWLNFITVSNKTTCVVVVEELYPPEAQLVEREANNFC